jgi:2-amino-4-hydroxy-6-hydroxymethyldihydropteridine diphosphokinase
MKKLFLGIGTNLGERNMNLDNALDRIVESIGLILKLSSVYESEPWGFSAENRFLNMVVEADTELSPQEVLAAILMIESLMGRTRSDGGYSSRIIDIDILLYEDLIINEANLKIPHPHIHERKFVLVPLCEIASDLVHPGLKVSFGSLLNSCPDKNDVSKFYYKS